MAKHKIPRFCSTYFASLSDEEKAEFVHTLATWKNNEVTDLLISYLDDCVTHSHIKEDEKTLFTSLFESKYSSAYSKAERVTYRNIRKQLKD